MLVNHFKIAFRNLYKSKTFSLLNILGLALGLAVFILIMLWVQYEKSYDSFHEGKERIAAVMTNLKFDNGEIQTFPAVPSPLAAAVQRDVAGIEYAATASWGDNRQFTLGNKNFIEYGLYVSPEFLQLFSFSLLKGDGATALREPNAVLLTEKLAKKYFGNEDPVGKIITVQQQTPCKVTGVLKDIPANATLRFDFLMPMKDYLQQTTGGTESWGFSNMRAFVKLKAGADFEAVNKSFSTVLARYTNEQPKASHFLWKLEDWYLRFDFKNGVYAGGGRITYVHLFILIAIFILLLACINFMNLSTARATQRAKEVGVRKVIGAGRWTLFQQFMSESLLMAFLSGLVAVGLVALALPAFNNFFRKEIALPYGDVKSIGLFFCIITATGLLAGSYPALVLSAFKPIRVLKQIITPSPAGTAWVRKALVVTQFTVSVVLITATIIVSRQLHYLHNRDLGFNKENLIWFANDISTDKNETALRELEKVPGVISASQASANFVMSNNRGSDVNWPGKQQGQDVFFSFIAGSNTILKTLGLTVKQGRGFSASYLADTSYIMVNEEAVRRMGLKDPIGQEVTMPSGKFRIAGIVKDFHFESLHQPIAPVIITCRPNWTWNLYVRLDGKDIQRTIKGIEAVYNKMAPGFVFDYNFQDKEYDYLYRSEQQVGTLVNGFAFFAMLISCLGLLGLTAYTVSRKTKEIGIRKVLGASVTSITALVSRQFVWLIVVAILLASAPAYYFMHNWLQGYAYRIGISWWMFVTAGLAVLLIALLTVSVQAVKAALANPVKSLRSE